VNEEPEREGDGPDSAFEVVAGEEDRKPVASSDLLHLPADGAVEAGGEAVVAQDELREDVEIVVAAEVDLLFFKWEL
jgi:hypothetical protein